jgi:microcystin-dependent protein
MDLDAYIGQIMLFAGDFAPRGWKNCDGSKLPVQQNQALFSVIGTLYGGDSVNFALPDLRSRVPVGLNGADPAANVVGHTSKPTTIAENHG